MFELISNTIYVKSMYFFTLAATQPPVLVQEILEYEQTLSSKHHYEKALSELPQNRPRAFVHFLKALEKCSTSLEPSDEDKMLYDSLMQEYLSKLGQEKAGVKITGEIISAAQHLFIATEHLNKERYVLFFEHFYQAYPYFNESYLSLRAQGILLIRLAALVSTQEQKQYYRERGVDFLQRSLHVCQNDCSVYEILVNLAKEEENDLLLTATLETLVESRSIIPRHCVYLFVREAIRLERVEIAQKIIDRAKELYEYCKATAAAEQYLNQYQNRSGETIDATRVSR
jgi:hypothetical protein